jgi:hypothetical protein
VLHCTEAGVTICNENLRLGSVYTARPRVLAITRTFIDVSLVFYSGSA